MAAKKSKAKKSSITKKPPPPPPPTPYSHRQQWPFSHLPPTNPSDHPRAYKLWATNRSSAPAITKSWLPTTTTTRCDAHHNQQPQLRHVATGPTQNPSPHPRYHYLHDSTTIVEAASKLPDASHWRVLSYAPAARITNPAPELHSGPLGPMLHLNRVFVPDGPSSGLMVSYAVSRASGRYVFWDKSVAVWHECATADPFDAKKKSMEFMSLVCFQGNYYAMSLQGALAVMQVVDTRLRITAVTSTRAVPRSRWRSLKEYLFEMNGEILLVFLIHRESPAVVDHVEVFQLDLVRIDWVKVDRLRGKTVFLKEECIWVDSEEFGCRDDRVYFTEGSEKWKVFNMKTCSISPVPIGWSWQSKCSGR